MSGEAILQSLEARIGDQPDLARRIEALVLGLADAVKATSNDQNVQRLSRELRAAADALASTTMRGHAPAGR